MQPQSSKLKFVAIGIFVLGLAGSVLLFKGSDATDHSDVVTPEETAGQIEKAFADTLPKADDSLKSFKAWVEQPASYKPKLDEGIELAKRRALHLKALMRSDPAEALQQSFSFSEYAKLPPEVAQWVEKPFSSQVEVVVLPNEAEVGGHQLGLGEKSLNTQIKLQGEREFLTLHRYGSRSAISSKNGLSGQGISLGGEVVLSDQPLSLVAAKDVAFVLKNFPPASQDTSIDFYTQQAITNTPVLALAGGHVFYFSNKTNIDTLNRSLLELEQRPGPKSGSQILFEMAASTQASFSDGLPVAQRLAALSSAANEWTTSLKKVFYIRIDFSDKPGAPISQQALFDELNGSTSQLIRNMSRAKTSIQADVSDSVVRLPNRSSYYAPSGSNALYDDAIEAFENSGASDDLSEYDIVGIYFTKIGMGDSSSYAGLASIGGGRQWLQGDYSTRVVTHEFGHNYGLQHANFWTLDDGGVVAGNGLSEEYGDSFDIMGSGSAEEGHFHPQALSKLEWLKANEWQQVTSSGVYRVRRFDDKDASGLQGLKISRGNGDFYWLGHRENYNSNPWMENGIYLIWQPSGYEQSWLIDTTPNSYTNHDEDKLDAGVVLGRTYSDSSAGVHITPIAKGGAEGAEWIDVKVQMGNVSGNAKPVVTIQGISQASARTPITFTAIASDPDGDELAYHWDFGDTVVHDNSSQVSHTWTVGGDYKVKVTVSDAKGKTATQQIDVTVEDPLLAWTKRAANLTSSNLKAIAGSDQKLLIVGDTNGAGGLVVLQSENGTDWVSEATSWKYSNGSSFSTYNLHFEAMIYDDLKWIAVGRDYDFSLREWVGTILDSADGKSWTVRHYGGPGLYGIASGNDALIAVGNEGQILKSVNEGATWVNKSQGVADYQDIAFGDNKFIVVGLNEWTSFSNTDGVVLTSSNGNTWQEATDSGDLPTVTGIAYLNDRFIGSGFYAGIRYQTSQQSSFVSARDVDNAQGPQAFAFANGVYLALGSPEDSFISGDGYNWQTFDSSAQATKNAVVYFNGSFVSVGDQGEIYQSQTTSTRPGNTDDNDNDGIKDASDLDDDNDGIPDAWELKYGLNPLNPFDAEWDLDEDTISNLDEYRAEINPAEVDTDGDGTNDDLDQVTGTGFWGYACNVVNTPTGSRKWGINQYNLSIDSAPTASIMGVSKNRKIQSVACDPAGEIALFSMKESQSGDYEIYQLDLETNQITQLTDNDTDDVDVSMSNDKRMMTWQKRLADGRQAIELRNLELGTSKTLASASPFVQPSLSTNGRWLTFVQLRSNFFAVMRYDVLNNKYKEIRTIARRKKLHHPSISDDGNLIGWAENLSQGRYVLKNLADNSLTEILNNPNGIEHAVLTGDGQQLIYSINTTNKRQTFITNVDSLDTVRIGSVLRDPNRYTASSWQGGSISGELSAELVADKVLVNASDGSGLTLLADGTGYRNGSGVEETIELTWSVDNGILLLNEAGSSLQTIIRVLHLADERLAVSVTREVNGDTQQKIEVLILEIIVP